MVKGTLFFFVCRDNAFFGIGVGVDRGEQMPDKMIGQLLRFNEHVMRWGVRGEAVAQVFGKVLDEMIGETGLFSEHRGTGLLSYFNISVLS